MRIVLYFLLASGLLFAFFYFYPAAIFQATIEGGIAQVTADVSLQTLIFKKNLPAELVAANITSIKPTMQGWLILVVCLIALPLMIAFRFGKDQN